jgi:hypothetical protein
MLDKINDRLNTYERKIESLTQTVSDLQIENKNLKIKNLELLKNRNYFLQIENNNKFLCEDQKMKGNRIKDLENEVLKVTENGKEESRNLQKNLESEILYYKGLNETSLSKIYAADKIIKLNETQHNIILKLENKIDEIKSENEDKMNKLELAHERHYLKLKKQMLDYIKATQQATSKSNEFNLELNSKFGILYKNQMLNELENQSKQIEDLLKTKERHQKIIWVLQQEIKTHKKIEEMIIKKNNTYLNIAKKTKNMNESNEFLSSKKIPLLNYMKGNDCLTERNSNSRSIFHSLNKKEYHDYKSLEKIYKELLDEYREIKNKYNTLKDKEKNNNIKYKGIINLFNDALDGLMQDEEIKSKKNIYININEINKGNFESLTKEEKYFILVKLLTNLLSLITINEKEEKLISLKDNIKNVEFKLKKPKIIHRNKYFETPKLQKPFLGMTSSNFYNISTNYESNTNSNERQHFVSIFGDDFIQFGKNIFPEANSVKKERDSYKNNYEKINKKKSLGDKNKKKLYEKANKYIIRKSREKEENNLLTEGNRKSRNDNQNINYQIKRGNTYDKQFIRELVI